MSDAKIKEGVFVGPHKRQLILHDMFDKTLNETVLAAWKNFKQVCVNFLGLHKSDDFEDVMTNLLHNYHEMGCKMSLKVHYLHSHLKGLELKMTKSQNNSFELEAFKVFN